MSGYPEIHWSKDLKERFTIDEIIARLPEKYHAKLRVNIDEKIASGQKIRIFCDGVFDLFHLGHARIFEQVKHMFPGADVHVIAGVCADVDILQYKGEFVSPNMPLYKNPFIFSEFNFPLIFFPLRIWPYVVDHGRKGKSRIRERLQVCGRSDLPSAMVPIHKVPKRPQHRLHGSRCPPLRERRRQRLLLGAEERRHVLADFENDWPQHYQFDHQDLEEEGKIFFDFCLGHLH